MSPPRPRTPPIASRLALMLPAALLALGTVELVVWLLPPLHPMDNPWYINASPDIDHANLDLPFIRPPHLDWTGPSRGNLAILNQERDPNARTVRFRTDHQGFRNGRDLDQADIAFVGDSFTEAGNIPEDETFVQLTAAALGLTGRNLGMAGYAPPIERIVLTQFALPLNPRIVVWQVAEDNDLEDCVRYAGWLQHGRPRAGEAEAPGRLTRNQSWAWRSPLCQLRSRWGYAQSWTRGPSGTFTQTDGRQFGVRILYTPAPAIPPDQHAGWADLTAALAAGQAQLRTNGIDLVVFMLPMKFRVLAPSLAWAPAWQQALQQRGLSAPDWDLPPERQLATHLARACASNAITFIDLTPTLRAAASAGQLVYQPLDTHLSTEGHRVVAAALTAALRQRRASAPPPEGPTR